MSDESEYLSEESYEFEFEEDDEDIDIENQDLDESPENTYYHAKGLKEESLAQAIEWFEKLVAICNGNSDAEWKFKAHKQLAKIHFQQQKLDLVLKEVAKLMKLLPQLNGNFAEESVGRIITRYTSSQDHVFVKGLYDVIVSHIEDFLVSGSSGHRLWLKININRLNSFLELGDLDTCQELIVSINNRLEAVSESTKNSYALEIIAAEIEYVMKTSGQIVKLRDLHRKSQTVTPAITHPRVTGVVRECGATVQFYKGNFEKAQVEFYESFKNYDEAGSEHRKTVLKYLILCCILAGSKVNPFESQETQSYARLPEYENLIDLVRAYEDVDLEGFMDTVRRMKEANDPLFHDQIFNISREKILRKIKTKIFISYSRAYRTIKFDFIIEKLCLEDDTHLEQFLIEVVNEDLVVDMKINFVERHISFISTGKNFFPVTLDEKTVKNNSLSLDSISLKDLFGPLKKTPDLGVQDLDVHENSTQLNVLMEDQHTDSTTKPEEMSVFERLFGSSTHNATDQKEWLKFMRSSISQKERVVTANLPFEQREYNTRKPRDSRENDEANARTQEGLLGSVLDSEDQASSQKEVVVADKLDSLLGWAHQLLTDSF